MKSDYIPRDTMNFLMSRMNYENALALRVSCETGLRIGDVLKIKPEELNGNTLSFVAEKTGKKGTAKLTQDLTTRLRRISGKEYIFQHRSDPHRHRTRQAVWKDLRRVSTAYGVTKNTAALSVSPHSARKLNAVEYYQKNGLGATQRHLQHDRDITTLIYALSDKIAAEKLHFESITDDSVVEKIAQKVVEKLLQSATPGAS